MLKIFKTTPVACVTDIWFVTLHDAGNPIVGVVLQIKFKHEPILTLNLFLHLFISLILLKCIQVDISKILIKILQKILQKYYKNITKYYKNITWLTQLIYNSLERPVDSAKQSVLLQR